MTFFKQWFCDHSWVEVSVHKNTKCKYTPWEETTVIYIQRCQHCDKMRKYKFTS